ncbi:uncharacterized protein UV8b_02024 [Ustilaginoidea virens]|uniref:N(5)-glutamine methyltransferase MTQ2 n=1 Tax=Ustilaginoidea virens TaxID=1159556 RepID=A0A1B5L6D6_USTVR|nr:uncharacterized protein UV8b_02024 [Ustilaginoidea virens]QUC17783.1 hypothetical protein UV8b_02024 [Ustilaginoidea virens]GAO19144.1 hypothetical protein UVI_02034740 [Ustilaginoidea virens]
MLPTPDTSHVPYSRVYEPAEDSFLLLDTLSSPPEQRFLRRAFPPASPAPLVLEVGTGSGVVLAFVNAHAHTILGRRDVLSAGVDMNAFACGATMRTVAKAVDDTGGASGVHLGACVGDLASSWADGTVDVLIFNPPYVPTAETPVRPEGFGSGSGSGGGGGGAAAGPTVSWDDEAYLLSLAYAGGRDGMETTDRLLGDLARVLSARGCAYVVLCAQNGPAGVRERIRARGGGWRAETVGSSGKTAGWERLQVVRIWREREDA